MASSPTETHVFCVQPGETVMYRITDVLLEEVHAFKTVNVLLTSLRLLLFLPSGELYQVVYHTSLASVEKSNANSTSEFFQNLQNAVQNNLANLPSLLTGNKIKREDPESVLAGMTFLQLTLESKGPWSWVLALDAGIADNHYHYSQLYSRLCLLATPEKAYGVFAFASKRQHAVMYQQAVTKRPAPEPQKPATTRPPVPPPASASRHDDGRIPPVPPRPVRRVLPDRPQSGEVTAQGPSQPSTPVTPPEKPAAAATVAAASVNGPTAAPKQQPPWMAELQAQRLKKAGSTGEVVATAPDPAPVARPVIPPKPERRSAPEQPIPAPVKAVVAAPAPTPAVSLEPARSRPPSMAMEISDSMVIVPRSPQQTSGPLPEDASGEVLPGLVLSTMPPGITYLSSMLSGAGWGRYSAQKEYTRIGVPDSAWRLCHENTKYGMSESYPRLIAIPATVSNLEINDVARYRSKGRVPSLCWRHPRNRATLCRSSQPMPGLTQKRSFQDEKLLQEIRVATSSDATLIIADARPQVNAAANSAKGKGTEIMANYPLCRLMFLDIENIHRMEESISRLRTVCRTRGTDATWLASLSGTLWLRHVQGVLTGAIQIAEVIANKGQPVLVHCSDGWDRTSQLTSLTELLLDPYFRTLDGFVALIEKEWLSYGHKFSDRCGLAGRQSPQKERSPIFLQFLDCVWQVYTQFPSKFQFNDELLRMVAHGVYSGEFGTFLYNCEHDRIVDSLSAKTLSLWDFLAQDRRRYINPIYTPVRISTSSVTVDLLIPSTLPSSIQLWQSLYFDCDLSVVPAQTVSPAWERSAAEAVSLREEVASLTSNIQVLERQLQLLESRASADLRAAVQAGRRSGRQLAELICRDILLDVVDRVAAYQRSPDSVVVKDYVTISIKASEADDDERSVSSEEDGVEPIMETSWASSTAMVDLASEGWPFPSTPPTWKNDKQAKRCNLCQSSFTAVRRKHHCRCCGDVYCQTCSSHKTRIPQYGYNERVRVCNSCFIQIMDHNSRLEMLRYSS